MFFAQMLDVNDHCNRHHEAFLNETSLNASHAGLNDVASKVAPSVVSLILLNRANWCCCAGKIALDTKQKHCKSGSWREKVFRCLHEKFCVVKPHAPFSSVNLLAKFVHVTSLNLSYNRLSEGCVTHLVLFPSLQVLDLSFNLICGFDEMTALSCLMRIAKVSFRGNSIEWFPEYRAHVIHRIWPEYNGKVSIVVDGKTVSSDERSMSARNVSICDGRLLSLCQSFLLGDQLSRITQRILIHDEIRQRMGAAERHALNVVHVAFSQRQESLNARNSRSHALQTSGSYLPTSCGIPSHQRVATLLRVALGSAMMQIERRIVVRRVQERLSSFYRATSLLRDNRDIIGSWDVAFSTIASEFHIECLTNYQRLLDLMKFDQIIQPASETYLDKWVLASHDHLSQLPQEIESIIFIPHLFNSDERDRWLKQWTFWLDSDGSFRDRDERFDESRATTCATADTPPEPSKSSELRAALERETRLLVVCRQLQAHMLHGPAFHRSSADKSTQTRNFGTSAVHIQTVSSVLPDRVAQPFDKRGCSVSVSTETDQGESTLVRVSDNFPAQACKCRSPMFRSSADKSTDVSDQSKFFTFVENVAILPGTVNIAGQSKGVALHNVERLVNRWRCRDGVRATQLAFLRWKCATFTHQRRLKSMSVCQTSARYHIRCWHAYAVAARHQREALRRRAMLHWKERAFRRMGATPRVDTIDTFSSRRLARRCLVKWRHCFRRQSLQRQLQCFLARRLISQKTIQLSCSYPLSQLCVATLVLTHWKRRLLTSQSKKCELKTRRFLRRCRWKALTNSLSRLRHAEEINVADAENAANPVEPAIPSFPHYFALRHLSSSAIGRPSSRPALSHHQRAIEAIATLHSHQLLLRRWTTWRQVAALKHASRHTTSQSPTPRFQRRDRRETGEESPSTQPARSSVESGDELLTLKENVRILLRAYHDLVHAHSIATGINVSPSAHTN